MTMLIDDEHDLRDALRALSAAPPPAEERVVASVRRARAIRRRRATAAAVAVLVPVAVVGGVLARPQPAPRIDYTNVANWPDRGDATMTLVRQVALEEWLERNDHDLGPGESVRWLYSGRVPATGDIAVAFATCAADVCSRAVLLYDEEATAGKRDGDRSSSEWVGETRDLPPGAPMAPLSAYHSTDDRPETGSRTVLFVLAAPHAAAVSYASPPVAGRGGVAGELAPSGGAFAGDVGYLAADATISVRDGRGRVLHTGKVGDGEAVGRAERLDLDVELPRGFTGDGGARAQLGRDGFSMLDTSAGTERHALFVRCRGGSPLRVTMNGAEGEVPCDGRTHQATPLVPAVDIEHDIEDDDETAPEPTFHYRLQGADPYTVLAVALAKRG